MRFACTVIFSFLFAVQSFATVTLVTTAATLKTASGAPMPTSGLVLLVASTTDSSFTPPNPFAFVSDDDVIVGRWDLSAVSEPGLLLDLTTMTMSGAWNAGDPLQLYWYPTLTLSATAPGAAGIPYGQYRSDSALDGGVPWVTPGDGSTIDLYFLTADSPVGGSNSTNAGNASLVVAKAPAIVTLTGLSHVYDGAGKLATADTIPSGLTVNLTYNGSPNAPTNAGSYTVVGTITDANYAGSVTNTLTVTPKSATVVADAKSKIYGEANPALTAVVTGTVGSDTLNYTLATTALTTSGVGSYPISVTLGSNPNYSVTKTDSTLTVTPKAATVVADAKSKIYGEANPALTAVVTGTVGSDTLNYSLATTALTTSGVGSYPISVTLGSNPNYSVTKTDSTLTVTPKAATVVADAKSKIYGEANPALTAVVTGTVGSDTLNYSLATTALTTSGVGSYPISVTLGSNPNYSVTKTDSTLTVTPKSATVVADAKSKIYGEANPALTAVVTGTVGSDTLNYTLATTALTTSGVGSYPISVTLGSNPNYSVTKTDSTLTILTDDTDGDGIPDAYEVAHGMNANNAADARADFDGDRFNNLQEFLAGTDPADSSSALRITSVQVSGQDILVSCLTATGRLYQLERTLQFPTGQWNAVGQSVPGNGSTITITDPSAHSLSNAIYRISVTNAAASPTSSPNQPASSNFISKATLTPSSPYHLCVRNLRPA